ncbi:hypothetical protein BH10PSE17_BH10PSE17_37720 [soil metagenome]
MNAHRLQHSIASPRLLGSLAVLAALWLSAHPIAAHGQPANATAQSAERKACEDGSSGQDKATCLRELGAARTDKAPSAATGDAAALKRNALARCESVAVADRDACRARVEGNDTTGSVKGGGVLREHREIVPPPVQPVK